MLFALVGAGNMLGFTMITGMISQFITFGSSIIGGIITIVIGMLMANLVRDTMKATSQSPLSISLVRGAIIFLSVAIGLGQMGIAENVINIVFSLGVGAIAVAFALSVGLGAKDEMGKIVTDWLKSLKK